MNDRQESPTSFLRRREARSNPTTKKTSPQPKFKARESFKTIEERVEYIKTLGSARLKKKAAWYLLIQPSIIEGVKNVSSPLLSHLRRLSIRDNLGILPSRKDLAARFKVSPFVIFHTLRHLVKTKKITLKTVDSGELHVSKDAPYTTYFMINKGGK